MNIFHISEVVDLGIEKEKKRRDFYAMVAERFENHEIKKLFTQLRDWEEMHIKKFTEIRNSLPQESGVVESYQGEINSYMQVVVDEKLYSKISPAEFSKMVKSELDAINYGLQFEKDAILLFVGLTPYVDDVYKEVIQKLIEEERQHIIYLFGLKKKLAA